MNARRLFIAATLVASLATTGCASAMSQVTLEAVPADAAIYVDGEQAGTGTVHLLVNEHDLARTLDVEVKRGGQVPLRRQLASRPDLLAAAGVTAVLLGLAGANFWLGQTLGDDAFLVFGGLNLALAPLAYLGSHRFEPRYTLELPQASPEARSGTP